jgi:hypothetical protein
MKVVKTGSICAIASLVLAAVLFLEWLQPQAYSAGMVLPSALLSRAGIHVEQYGVDLAGLSEKEIGSTAVAGIYDRDCGLYLEVNTSNRILKVQRWKWIGIDFLTLIGRLKQIVD